MEREGSFNHNLNPHDVIVFTDSFLNTSNYRVTFTLNYQNENHSKEKQCPRLLMLVTLPPMFRCGGKHKIL
jgi:hypothetical protein